MVNRCAHKGALVCLQERGNAKALTCVYHSWSYDLTGRLQSVAFRHGVRGKGGMPEDFDPSAASAGAAARRSVLRAGVRHILRCDRTGGDVSRRDDGAHDPPQSRPAASDTRHAQPDHPQQLEAVRRERARFVSRHAAAHVLYHVQGEPAGHGWRHAAVRRWAAFDQLRQARARCSSPRNTRRSIRRSTTRRWRRRSCWIPGPSSTTASPTASRRYFPTLVVQLTLNSLAVRFFTPRGIDKTELFWIYLGYQDDDANSRRGSG